MFSSKAKHNFFQPINNPSSLMCHYALNSYYIFFLNTVQIDKKKLTLNLRIFMKNVMQIF